MKSLLECFNGIKRVYYSININASKLFCGDESFTNCERFINRMFRTGSKEIVFDVNYYKSYKQNGKHQHTVSLFLIGKVLKNIFEEYIGKSIGYFTQFDNFSFDYYWFITSLSHDMASCIEMQTKKHPVLCEQCFASKILEKSEIDDRIKEFICRGCNLRFSEETVMSYYNYRKQKDHGIVGGIYLYQRLVSNFVQKTRGKSFPCGEEIINNKLYRPQQVGLFSYIADAIICHNIWMAYDEKTIKEYKENGLDKLIIKNPQDRLSLNHYPLQFALCLLDTIEPIKRFMSNDFSAKDVLENIYLANNENKITLGWTKEIKKRPEFFKWLGNIAELPKWMDVTVSECYHMDNICCIDIIVNR